MIHLDDGVLRAWLDRELASDHSRDVGRHVGECLDCRARVRELQRAEEVVHGALSVLDGPVPGESAWDRVSADLAARDRVAPLRPPRSVGRQSWARAAGFVLLFGGGLAAAVLPGSPLRSLWDSGSTPPPSEVSGLSTSDATPDREFAAGVRAATQGAVRIELRAPAGTSVEVVLTGRRAGVFGPPTSSFSTGEGWLRAELVEGPVRVELPAVGATARIEVNGRSLVAFDDGRLVRAPSDAATGDDPVRLRFDVR